MRTDGGLAPFRADVRAFADREIASRLPEWEEQALLPRDAFQLFAGAGLLGLHVPRALGGTERSYKAAAIVAEELGRIGAIGPCTSLFAIAGVVCPLLVASGSAAQHARLLAPIVGGTTIASIGITEPTGGSDLANAIQTTARRTGRDRWTLDGEKLFITNAPIADVLLVLARTRPGIGLLGMTLFAVPATAVGLTATWLDTLGLRSSPTGRVRLRDCSVPGSAVVGRVDRGYPPVATMLQRERLLAVVAGLALARSCIDATGATASGDAWRRASRTHGIGRLLAEVEAGRAYAWALVDEVDGGTVDVSRIALAKATLGDLVRRATIVCHRLGTGHATMIERGVLDARAISVFAGSSEMMRDVASARLLSTVPRARAVEGVR
ncbi:MAG: acyl-CoA dehydrogenase family protein [Tepidisphaeraceae bacterium]